MKVMFWLEMINGNIFWKKFGYHGHSAKETKKR